MMLAKLARWHQRSEGATAALFALLLPVIIGMAALTVDVAHAFVERRELQNAADAGALAAAAYLPTNNPAILNRARDAAIDYAGRNGAVIAPADVVFSSVRQTNDTVTVRTAGVVGFAFAGVLGVSFGAVSSRGAGQLGMLGALPNGGVMPWGIEEPVGGFDFGATYCLKLDSGNPNNQACQGPNQGNFHALDIDQLGNDSASTYEDRIINGSYNPIKVTDIRNVSRGNMSGPTAKGTGCQGNSGRISGNNDVFSDVVVVNDAGIHTVLDWNNPRIVLIPLVDFIGKDDAEILGFLVFFIEGCTPNGGVLGTFIETFIPDGEWSPVPVGGSGGASSRKLRLIE